MDKTNYAVSNGVSVNSVDMALDGKTVFLKTSSLTEQEYIVTINNVADIAANPNTILPDTKIKINHKAMSTDLVAWYRMNEFEMPNPFYS